MEDLVLVDIRLDLVGHPDFIERVTLLTTYPRLILPILGEYLDSGYRTPKDRIIYSLKSNAQFYLIAMGCSILGLFYIFWQNGFRGTSFKGLVMALAYCIGLVQAVLLLGHGLVAVPRRTILNADHRRRLRALQGRAPGIRSKLDAATEELEELQSQVQQLQRQKSGLSGEYQDWIEELAVNARIVQGTATTIPRNVPSVPGVITDRFLAELGRRIIRTRHKYVRFVQTWRYLVEYASEAQAVIDAHASKRLGTRSKNSLHSWISPQIRYTIYANLIPKLRLGFGVLLTGTSLGVVWSELVKPFAPRLSMISVTTVHQASVNFAGQLVSFWWILYMCTCVLASFDDVKVWGNRALVRRNTYFESACWYSLQVAKMTVPLTYNFLTLMPEHVHYRTVFYQFLGSLIDLTPLGKGFDYFFPMFVILPAAATLFNLYGRVRSCLVFDIFDDEGNGNGRWIEGRELLEREMLGRSRLESPTRSEEPLEGPQFQKPAGRSLGPRTGEPTARLPDSTLRPSAGQSADDEAADNVFGSFAHRVQNTVDSWERPQWLQEIGKRPRWMGGDNDDTMGRQRTAPGGMGRWLGGRSASGRIQL